MEKVNFIFSGRHLQNVSKIRIYFSETLDPDGGFASCVQINFFYAPYTIYPEVTHMTASEFAGHIDDIGSEYDMIYIGDKKTDADHSLITGNGILDMPMLGLQLESIMLLLIITGLIFLNFLDSLIQII